MNNDFRSIFTQPPNKTKIWRPMELQQQEEACYKKQSICDPEDFMLSNSELFLHKLKPGCTPWPLSSLYACSNYYGQFQSHRSASSLSLPEYFGKHINCFSKFPTSQSNMYNQRSPIDRLCTKTEGTYYVSKKLRLNANNL